MTKTYFLAVNKDRHSNPRYKLFSRREDALKHQKEVAAKAFSHYRTPVEVQEDGSYYLEDACSGEIESMEVREDA